MQKKVASPLLSWYRTSKYIAPEVVLYFVYFIHCNIKNKNPRNHWYFNHYGEILHLHLFCISMKKIRAVGLEPTRLAAQEPKSCASPNSAMPASLTYYRPFLLYRLFFRMSSIGWNSFKILFPVAYPVFWSAVTPLTILPPHDGKLSATSLCSTSRIACIKPSICGMTTLLLCKIICTDCICFAPGNRNTQILPSCTAWRMA